LPLRAAKLRGIGEKKKGKSKKWPAPAKIIKIVRMGVFGRCEL
jgi:hypothetical protein